MTPAVASSPPASFTGSSAGPASASDPTAAAGTSPDATAVTGPPGTAAGTPAGQFASVLEQVARTAAAEGQDKKGQTDGAPAGDKKPSGQGAAAATDPATGSLAAALSLGAIAAAAASATTATATAAQAGAAQPGQAAGDPAAQAALAAAIAGAAATAGSPESGPDQATAATPGQTGPDRPAQAGAASATPAPGQATPVNASTPGTPGVDTLVAGLSTAGHAGSGATPHGQDPGSADAQPGSPQASLTASTSDQSSTTQPAAAAVQPAATTLQAHAGQDSTQIQGAQFPGAPVDATQAQPSTPAAPADAATAVRYGVGLEKAVETIRMTIDLAARQGASQARIQLSPAELGGIRILLSQTTEGLVARVVAEHAAAAQTLQQHGAELRRSLESTGVPLLRLDIEASGERSGSANEPFWSGARSGQSGQSNSNDPGNADLQDEASAVEPVAVELSNGAIVNVLA
jgi:flagellar hook-length control protein FliK